MSIDAINRIGMIEVLLDEALTDEEQVILDRGELTIPDNEQSPELNYGPISLGGGE